MTAEHLYRDAATARNAIAYEMSGGLFHGPAVAHTVERVKRPKVQYARADDGVTIAYSALGEGPVTVALISPLVSQVEVAWEEPAFEHFVTRLATCARVVMFDRRGTGLSDHTTASGDRLALPQLARDVNAVLDHSDTEQAVLFGISLGSMTAVQHAFDFPGRVLALVLVGGAARLTSAPGFEFGMDPGAVDEWADHVARSWGTGTSVEADSPAMQSDARYREWAARLERHTCSPGMVAASLRYAATYDVRPLLGHISAPALVVQRSHDRATPVAHGRYLAENLPDATYVELDGEEHMYFLGDQQEMLDTIFAFLDDRVAGGRLRAAIRRAERRNAFGYGWESLTPSERDVATLVASGMTNNEVAERLRMSRFTVDGRLRRVFAKLDVSTRVELTAEYARVAR